MTRSVEFYTVGELREALEGVPDGTILMCQVSDQNHQAWNLHGKFYPPKKGPASLVFTHPDLNKLPDMGND